MKYKITSVILLLALTLSTFGVYGSEYSSGFESRELIKVQESNKIYGETSGIVAYDTGELQSEVNKVYEVIGETTDMQYEKVRLLHIMAGGSVAFFNRRPDVMNDTTVVETFGIPGSMYTYYKDFVYDKKLIKADKYNILSSGLNVCGKVKSLMNKRELVDRGDMQVYFDNLLPEVKDNILFYEALMEYMQFDKTSVDNFYISYEKTVQFKDKSENVIYLDENGNYAVKDVYKQIFEANSVQNIDKISLALSADGLLASTVNSNDLREYTKLPYIAGYTSRAELIKAGSSLIGRVRYVWGGGHGFTSKYIGINPVWQKFDSLYKDNEANCIKPSGSWCPTHGVTGETANGCLFKSEVVDSLNDIITLRSNYYTLSDVDKILMTRQLGESFEATNIHRIEGLDCSGFVSWVFNQIDCDKFYNSSAAYFNGAGRLEDVKFGEDLVLGDTIAWDKHIALAVGKVSDTSKVYVIIEMRPNTVMFGTAYYPGATAADIRYAKELARQANLVVGNVKEPVSCYDLQAIQYRNSTETVNTTGTDGVVRKEVVTYSQKVLTFGRLYKVYLDEDCVVEGYDKSIEDMNAKEILQFVIDELPYNYKDGVLEYNNEQREKLFNVGV